MSNRVTTDSGNTVSLFPFLAVLLCTMGALLVLLVVLAQRAGERALVQRAEQTQQTVAKQTPKPAKQASPTPQQPTPVAPTPQPSASKPTLPDPKLEELQLELEQTLAQSQDLKQKRAQVEERLSEEQEKLAHLEEHTRRLEHEVAQLSVAAQQLEATENKQVADQEQAERELQRLKKLIADKKQEVEELQETSKGKKTYAIVPFLGKDGVEVPRIYLECSSEGVLTQPEGLLFDKDDFRAPGWAGNPLAQVVRATQQHIQSKARNTGGDQSYALPLIIVRPSGIEAFHAAQDALSAAEIPYGFDFVGGSQELTYPVSLDPQLANIQYQARLHARRHLMAQIESAPRKYKAMLERLAASSGDIGVGTSSAKAALFARLSTDGYSTNGGDGGTSGTEGDNPENSSFAGGSYGDPSSTEGSPGALANYGDATSWSEAGSAEGDTASNVPGSAANNASGQMSASTFNGGGQAGSSHDGAMAVQSQGGSSAGAAPGASAAGGASGSFSASGNTQQGNGTGNSDEQSAGQIAARTRNAVPIQRPIQVVVRNDHLTLLPSRHTSSSNASTGTMVSLNQSSQLIAKELSLAVRDHMQEWGIAGQGLYWKPVLNLKVGPDGIDAARRLEQIMSGSGLRVITPDHVRVSEKGAANAPR